MVAVGLGLLPVTREIGVWSALEKRLWLFSVRERQGAGVPATAAPISPAAAITVAGKATSPQNTDAHLTSRDFASGR